MDVWQEMTDALNNLRSADLGRRERVIESPAGAVVTVSGREVICLCSNDYLALAADSAVRAAATEAIAQWGVGAAASRLVSGTTPLHVELEQRLAGFKDAEAAIVTSTGWMANRAVIGALAGRGDLVLCDKLNHASMIDAARSCGALLRTYSHCDMTRLEQLLKRLRSRYHRCLIVTDSLFSMDGDFAPLGELADLKRRFDAQLLIDEAHATGVMGRGGRGVAELMGVEDQIDATVGTLSKALGAMGGFVAGRQVLIDTIRNTARAYIYTTAPPAAICAAAVRALDIVRDEPDRRERLLSMAEDLRERLRGAGLEIGRTASQIFPVILGDAARALAVSERLFEAGFLVPAIRPPTVPRGTSRLRVSLSADHDPADLARFVDALTRAMQTTSNDKTI